MGWESSGVVVLIACLFLVLEVWDGKPTYLFVWSDLTLDPYFKVK